MRLINANSAHCITCWLLGFITLAISGTAPGAEWSGWVFDPTFAINQEFNDNPRMSFGAGQGLSAKQKDAAFITTVSPGLLLRRHTERWQVNLAARLAYNIYTGTDVPNRDSERIELRSLFHVNERNLFQLGISYKRDTLIRRISVDIDEGIGIDGGSIDPGEDIDIGLVGASVRRNRINLAPSWRYQLTERTGIQLTYSFIDQFYSELEGVKLIDTLQHKLVGTTFYNLTPLSSLSFNVEASKRISENNTQTDNLAFLAGLTYPFSKLLSTKARAGYRITSTDHNGNTQNSNGFVGQLAVQYSTKVGVLSGTISRQITPSGSGQTRLVDRLRLQYSRALLPRLSFVLKGDVFRAQSAASGSSGERRYFDVGPTLSWNWTRWWAIQAGYHFRRRYTEGGSSSQAANSNGVFVAITYTPPPAVR